MNEEPICKISIKNSITLQLNVLPSLISFTYPLIYLLLFYIFYLSFFFWWGRGISWLILWAAPNMCKFYASNFPKTVLYSIWRLLILDMHDVLYIYVCPKLTCDWLVGLLLSHWCQLRYHSGNRKRCENLMVQLLTY